MATYYVSATTGNDSNNGTSVGTPKATIGAGEDLAQSAGDVVFIAPGTYREKILHGYSGTADDRIYFIGDIDSEIFTDINPGIVRITMTDANNLASGVVNQAAVDTNNKDYITWKNVSVDGGTYSTEASGDSTGNSTRAYGFYCDNVNDNIEVINCMTQVVHYGFWRVGMIVDCVGFAAYIPFVRCGVIERCIGLGSTAYDQCESVKNSLGIGNSNTAFYENDFVQNCTAFGASTAYDVDEDDQIVLDSHGIYSQYFFRGGRNNSNASDNGIMSSSFASSCRYLSDYGNVQGLAWDACQRHWQSNRDPIYGRNGSTDMQGDGLLWEQRPVTLFSINTLRKMAECIVPISCEGVIGSTTADRDATAGTIDLLGNPRIMGSPKHMLLNGGITSSRDIGAYEYSNIHITSSVSGSETGFSITDGGMFKIPIAISASSAITASVGVKHNKGAGIAVKPKIELILPTTHTTASVTSVLTTTPTLQHQSGSDFFINSTTQTANDNIFQTISVSASFDKQCEVELRFINQQTGSDSISTFSDLEIT